MMRNWNIGDPTDPDPIATWVESLARAFVRLESESFGHGAFAGRILQSEIGALRISEVTASPHWIHRRPRHIRDAKDDVVFANLQTMGIGLTRQHGRDLRTLPFDIAIADTLYPYDVGHETRFSLFSIAVPRNRLPADLLKEGCLRLSRSGAGRDIANMLINYSRLALDPRSSAKATLVYAEHVIDLLNIGISELRGYESCTRGPEIKLDLIRDFVRLNFRDQCLSAASAARAFGISERYVHKLFARTGRSFSEFLCVVRLEECARRLEQSAAFAPSIAQAAFEAGFSDLSYFNRRFKSHYSETPSEYRRRHRTG